MTVSTPTPPTPPKAAPAPAAAGAAVIRRIGGVEETASDRLVSRHLPAWVVSGLVHLSVILGLWLVFGFRPPEAPAASKLISATADKEPEEAPKDLTNEDQGFDPTVPAAIPEIERLTERTVEAVVTEEPPGLANSTASDPVAYAPAGLPSVDNTGGAAGDAGTLMQGGGGTGSMAPSSFPGRSGGTKSHLIKQGGGNDRSEAAVAKGLIWLAAQQKSNGSWEFDPKDQKMRHKDFTTSTGMALLPFLAAGVTHQSIGNRHQKIVAAGLRFLDQNLNRSTGKFNSGSPQYMYGHAIATMALCEAYGMTKDRALKEPAQAAINFIVSAQAPNGSWGYQPGVPGDTSIVGWEIQALRAAQLSKDLIVPDKTVKSAMKFLDSVSSGSRKAVYGYAGPGGGPGTSLTAVGLLCRYYMDGWGPGNGGMAEGVPGLFGAPKPGAKLDEPQTDRSRAPKTNAQVKANPTMPELYYFYYATQVVHFFEGPEWKEWNEGPKDATGKRIGGMRDWLVDVQNAKEPNLYGSWEPDSGTIGSHCGRIGSTCLSLLTLEVYYRHLPLYKRDNGAQQLADAVK